MPTQRYNATSGKFGKIFFVILSVELDRVCTRKWNTERVIIFQSVILKRSQGINNYVKICKRILLRLDCWNRGALDKSVKDMYNTDMGYLGKARGNKTDKQRHRTFSNIVLKGRLREAVQFVCDR